MGKKLLVLAAALAFAGATQSLLAADEPAVRQPALREAPELGPALSELITPNAGQEEGVSANNVLGMQVLASNGKPLGKVDDLIIEPGGGVTLVVVTPRGQRLRLPWSSAEFLSSGREVKAAKGKPLQPLVQSRRSAALAKPSELRLKEIVGNPVLSGDGAHYGTVQDVRVTQTGQVSAVMVDSVPRPLRRFISG